MSQKILITGATGFIGSHTYEELRKEYEVFAFKGDITKVSDWKKNLKAKPEVIIHIAGIRTGDIRDDEVNRGGIEKFFIACKDLTPKPTKIIYISTQAVYFGQKPPFKEEMKIDPQDSYAKSKFMAELAVRQMSTKYNQKAVILRLSTVLGPKIRLNNKMSGPLAKWIQNAKKGEPIEVFQDGNQTRDYINVTDAVSAIAFSLKNHKMEGVYNVGGGVKVKLIELAGWVKEATKSKSEIVIKGGQARIDDPRDLFSDTSKLVSLGWRPRNGVKEAVFEATRA